MTISRKIFSPNVNVEKEELGHYIMYSSIMAVILFILASINLGNIMYFVFLINYAIKAHQVYKVYNMYNAYQK